MSDLQPRNGGLSSRATSLEGGLNHSPRPSSLSYIAQPAHPPPAPALGATPALWFSAPDLRLARAAEAELVEPESQAQQRARAKFFDEVTSTDLRRWWYPVSVSEDLGRSTVLGAELLGDPIVLWRDREGTAVCLEDKCAHRSTPLSLGRVTAGGELECAYDGWRYDSEGNVTHIPALLPDRDIPTNACARRYPTVERDGLLWVWPGDATLPAYDIHARLPPILSPGSQSAVQAAAPTLAAGVARVSDDSDDDDKKGSQQGLDGEKSESADSWGRVFTSVMDLDVDQSVFVECFLDFPHLAYTQPSGLITHPPHPVPTPVQVEIKFQTDSPGVMATINRPEAKDASPVQVRFIPPCHVQISSNVDGYKFNQTIHCVPTRPGFTRLIYRHSRNYWNWIDWLPFVGNMYNKAWANRIMGEYNMLRGMQDRLRVGAKPWNAPIQADLLPRYYREWYKRCMVKHSPFFSTFAPSSLQNPATSRSSTATNTSGGQPPMTYMNPYGEPTARPFAIAGPPRYTLAHIPQPTPSQLGIIQAASAAAATAAVQASAGASRRGSIANLVGVGGVGGGATGSRRGSMIIMPPVSAPPQTATASVQRVVAPA
ncbi:hypothetical protein HDU86_005577 [Geranomyces michiganensis]|nr:hypothetical protein HDU86_005577 [Geranomyces michiganensis]